LTKGYGKIEINVDGDLEGFISLHSDGLRKESQLNMANPSHGLLADGMKKPAIGRQVMIGSGHREAQKRRAKLYERPEASPFIKFFRGEEEKPSSQMKRLFKRLIT
jgi:hypothetical protein